MKLFEHRSVRTVALVLCLALLVSTAVILGIVHAEDTDITNVSLTFTDGRADVDLFDDVTTYTAQKSISDCIVLPGAVFADIVPTVKLPSANVLDSETFYFDATVTEESRAYTFVGWHITNSAGDGYLPAQTVFQPGDTVTPEVLEKYASTDSLTLEAVWALCFFAENPYETMVYTKTGSYYYMDSSKSTGATGADDRNTGYQPTAPLATMEAVFDAVRAANGNKHGYDAYAYALMLTGNLDSYKNTGDASVCNFFGYTSKPATLLHTALTFKSLQDRGTPYTLNFKAQGYGPQVYCNLRFDNIEFKRITSGMFGTQGQSSEFQLYITGSNPSKNYVETTARLIAPSGTTPMTTLRPHQHDLVVVNGGGYSGVQTNYSSGEERNKTREWYFGRNASIGTITCGTTSAYESNTSVLYAPFDVTVTGGTITSFYGGSNGMNAICVGNRDLLLLGDASGNTKYDPKITNFYGGSNRASLFGDVTVKAIGCTGISNLYGGGYVYSATTYGNISITMEHSAVKGDLYGGGYNGNTEVTTQAALSRLKSTMVTKLNLNSRLNDGGDVTIKLLNSEVRGNVFGSGVGASQTVEEVNPISYVGSDWYDQNLVDKTIPYEKEFSTPATGFPSMDPETERILTRVYYSYSWTSSNQQHISSRINSYYAYQSVATVQDVDIEVNGSTVGTPGGTKGNVYGGGSLAHVLGNTHIKICNGSIIYGSVFGGGDGATRAGAVTVYYPADEATYRPPSYTINTYDTKGLPTKVTVTNQYPTAENLQHETYEWSSDPALKATGGVDQTARLIYSANLAYFGVVDGDTWVDLEGGEVKGSVFGGGNMGAVKGAITLNLSGGSYGEVFGGCNQANVGKSVTLNVSGGTAQSVFGGNNVDGSIQEQISVRVTNGTVTMGLYGGGNQAAYAGTPSVSVEGGSISTLYGGGLSASVDGCLVSLLGGEVTTAFGGGDMGVSKGDIQVTLSNAAQVGTLYGGANKADVNGDVRLLLTGGSAGSAFGGNNESGNISGTIAVEASGASVTSLYGGGNRAAYLSTPTVSVTGGSVTTLYGGGLQASVAATDLTLAGGTLTDVFGGGYEGAATETTVLQLSSTLKGSLYGGGYAGPVNGDTSVSVTGGEIQGSVYGGGFRGNVTGESLVNVLGGRIVKNVYGGGYAGTVQRTYVTVRDSVGTVTVNNNVFGGGEGTTATVFLGTEVLIDLAYDFEAIETPVEVASMESSGEITTEIREVGGPFSRIEGSVFGGGDLGMLGMGTINQGQNTAAITRAATAHVTVRNGHILGSVFGGGSGIGTPYDIYMGTVFGSTRVDLYGGYVEGNVYGGGTQSRLYQSRDASHAAIVHINENGPATGVSLLNETPLPGKVAIRGSVFGGGDRGNSATTNASVPTTVGNVSVEIVGRESGSRIYFVEGGVYGDGNLCLVNGHRTITMDNFTTAPTPGVKSLKTFHSLQRADEVVLNNSDFVLLGAIDLVEEGDLSIYSINRIEKLEMNDGSTVKLSQIVKFLSRLESDQQTDRVFVSKGNNGSNDYSGHGTPDGINGLSEEELRAYYETSDGQNMICVANGLYLEIKDVDGRYGTVKGLFTLELLYANPGEGGGFVYSDIDTSTGDFVCKTVLGHNYEPHPDFSAGTPVDGYYLRLPGKGYVPAEGVADGKTIYYERVENVGEVKYMLVVDTVGGELVGSKYEYYYWYINGSTINYQVSMVGYIGAEELSFPAEPNVIPQHPGVGLNYVLFSITEGENRMLSRAIKEHTYTLVQRSTALTDQEIAVEMLLGGNHLGFVTYDEANDTWALLVNGQEMSGYEGMVTEIANNILASNYESKSGTDSVTMVLHKSSGVDKEITNMLLTIEIDLYLGTESYSEGTSTLVFHTGLSIVRLVPKQDKFSYAAKNFAGVFNDLSSVMINGDSAFTAEYQTRYIAMAFPKNAGNAMQWRISAKGYRYYFCDSHGTYLTLDEGDNVINISETLSYKGYAESPETVPILTRANGSLYYEQEGVEYSLDLVLETDTVPLPRGTRITMIDKTEEKQTKYYYYVCATDVVEIDLNNFCVMGSNMTIASLDEASVYYPTYQKKYIDEQSAAVRVNERLIFVFDFSHVTWNDGQHLGSIALEHVYDGKDIMDYVTLDPSGTQHTRATPVYTNYDVNPESTGVEVFHAEIEGELRELGEASFSVTLEEARLYPNTCFEEGEFSLLVELLDGEGNARSFPAGAYMLFEGERYNPGMNSGFIVIPIAKAGEFHATVCSPLYSLCEQETDTQVDFRVSLYDSPDPLYYNARNTKHAITLHFEVAEQLDYSLSVEGSAPAVEQGAQFSATVRALSNDPNARVTVELYRKTANGYVREELSALLTEEPTASYHWTVAEGEAAAGTWRLVFRYGDCEEYLSLVVR